MPSLGSLYYELFIKDLTDQDLRAVEKKLKKLGVDLDTKKLRDSLQKAVESYKGKELQVGVQRQFLHDAIREALKKPEFPIKVRVEAASAQEAVKEALRKAGLQRTFKADDKRLYDAETRRQAALQVAAAKAAAQNALAEQRLAAAQSAAAKTAAQNALAQQRQGAALEAETRRQAAMQVAAAKAAAQNALAQQRLAAAQSAAQRATQSHVHSSISLGSALRGNIRIAGELGPMLASAYSVVALKNFMQKVVEIGGELEKQKLAMKAILGDEGFANTISSQINTLAVKSPFGVMELNQYAKQLTAFQIPYNELYDTMKRMADVSAAVGVDMGRIILAYGQVRAAKFLKGTELRQFTEANIPLIDMLAERFTKLKGEIVSAGDIMDMISNKEISFEDVKAVLWELTGEGGRFYNMQEVLSESLQAKWKNLADAVDLMFADIAKDLSGPLTGLAELLTELTSRWGTVAAAVTTAIGVYGAYRVAILLTNKIIAANNAALFLNSIAVGANITKWQRLKAKTAESLSSMLSRIKNFVLSAKGLVTIAAGAAGVIIEALVMLWQRNHEEMQKAKEFGEDLFTASAEGAKNLKQILDSTPVSSSGLGEVELSTGLEKLRTAIKDYSKTAEKDLLSALVNQKGEVASLAEQYDALREKAQQLQAAMSGDVSSQMSKTLASAIGEADGGWFDENLLTDVEDFAEALNNSQKYLAEAIADNKSEISDLVKMAKDVSPAFATIAESLKTDEQAFAELIRNHSLYANDLAKLEQSPRRKIGKIYMGYINEFIGDETELKNELAQTISKQIDLLALDGITPENATPGQKLNLVAWFDKVTEPLPEEGKRIAREIFENMWKIDLDDGRAERAIVDAFGSALEAAHPEIAKRLKAGFEIKDLEMIDYSDATMMVLGAADKVMTEMPQFKDIIQGYFDDNQFTARVLVEWMGLNQDSDLKKMLWSGDEKNLRIDAFAAEKIFDRMASGAKSTRDVRDNYIKEGKDIKERIKAAKANNAAATELENLNKEWNLHAESYRRAHFGDLEEAVKEKGGKGRDSGDALANELKAKFKDLKDAWAMYKSWQKSVGDEAAFDTVASSGLFKYIEHDEIPRSVEAYDKAIEELQNRLESAGVKGIPERENLLNDIIKTLFDVRKSAVDEEIKLALDKVSKEAERQLADWNLYDKIRKATGNESLAINIAFGMNADAETDYPALVKKQFNDIAEAAKSSLTFDAVTPEALAAAPTEVQKAWEDAIKKLQEYANEQKDAVADILSEYQSLQDKLIKIDADRDRKIKAIGESDMSAPDKAKYIQRINVEADYQKFTQSADYLKFFSGIYSLTMDKAQEIGDKIRLNLDQRLQAGTISAEDYYKEIERINQQLTKLRNVKSDALTFLTGGVKGLNQKKMEKADSDVLDQMTKVQRAEEALEKAKATGDIKQIAAAELTLRLAKQELDTRFKIRDAIVKDMESWQRVLDVVNVVSNIAGGLSDAFGSIRDMADAIGVDTESGAWDDIEAVMDTLTNVTAGVQKVVQSAMNGDIGGILSGAVSTITTPFTIWSQLHDKKLQKLIDRSKGAAQIMQNQYDILEKRMANFLGNAAAMNTGVTGGAYGKQRQLMQDQLRELEKQRQAEIDKKKTDNSVVEDYNKQIEEMKISIRDFALEAANTIYGIDLNGWAEQLGDSLIDAFSKGEDAAEAFDKTVGDIMRDVTSKMISQDILAPMFGDLRNFLFGENGMSGAFGSDFKLDATELAAMKTYLDKIKNEGIPAAEELFNAINSATGGMLDDTDKAKSGLSAGIQSITEDTADLLASYVNAIRASVAMNEDRWDRLLGESLPQISVIVQSQLDAQRQIAENTLRTAKATESLVKLSTSMEGSWRRIAMKEWGYY